MCFAHFFFYPWQGISAEGDVHPSPSLTRSCLPFCPHRFLPVCVHNTCWDGCLGGGGYILAAPWKQTSSSFHYSSARSPWKPQIEGLTSLSHTKDTPLWRRKNRKCMTWQTGRDRQRNILNTSDVTLSPCVPKEVRTFVRRASGLAVKPIILHQKESLCGGTAIYELQST